MNEPAAAAAAARAAMATAQAMLRATRRPMHFAEQHANDTGLLAKAKAKHGARTKSTSVLRTSCHCNARHQPQSLLSRTAWTQAAPADTDNPFPLPSARSATPYDVFHLPRSASAAEVKSRYYDLVKIYHPDRVSARLRTDVGKEGSEKEGQEQVRKSAESPSEASRHPTNHQQAHDNFKRICDAYALLSNEGRRRVFDRSGRGWDPTGSNNDASAGSGTPTWKGSYPRSAEEWAAYEAWSSTVSRGAPGTMHGQGWSSRGANAGVGGGGHDRFGWQQYAGAPGNLGAAYFYGYGHAHQHGNANGVPLYMSNHRFFLSVALLSMILALGQYSRLREESRAVSQATDQRHQSAVRSLDEARKFARSNVGRTRIDEIRRRQATPKQEVIEAPDVGRGGISGKEAYEERMQRIGRV